MAYTSPKTWGVGDVLTAADLNTYVRDNEKAMMREIAHASGSTNVSFTTGPTSIISLGSVAFDGSTEVIIEMTAHSISTNSSGGCHLDLYEDGSLVAELAAWSATSLTWGALKVDYRITPTAGSHTFEIKGANGGGAGSCSVNATGKRPIVMRAVAVSA